VLRLTLVQFRDQSLDDELFLNGSCQPSSQEWRKVLQGEPMSRPLVTAVLADHVGGPDDGRGLHYGRI
jgi:hypothetical protein